MKRFIITILSLTMLVGFVFAKPKAALTDTDTDGYIQERGWREIEKTKEMNLINRPSRDGGEYVVASEKIEVVIEGHQEPQKTPEVKLLKEPAPEFEDSKWYEGMYWYNNGIVELRAFECPEYFVPGRLK